MDRSRRIFLAGTAAALACRRRAAELPSPGNRPFAEAVIGGSRRRFPNPGLTSHDGRIVRLYDDFIRGRFVLLNFAYTRCQGKCPRGLRTLLAARSLLLPRLGCTPGLVTLTLDPEHDTPEVLGRFVAAHGGLGDYCPHHPMSRITEALEDGRVRVLLLFGTDMLSSSAGEAASLERSTARSPRQLRSLHARTAQRHADAILAAERLPLGGQG